MGIYFNFPVGWWAVLAVVYLPYFALALWRKSFFRQREVKTQFIFGFIALALGIVTELIAVSLHVWTYFPGNWPVVVWPGYFGAGLAGFQIVKTLDEKAR